MLETIARLMEPALAPIALVAALATQRLTGLELVGFVLAESLILAATAVLLHPARPEQGSLPVKTMPVPTTRKAGKPVRPGSN
jgi:hypothetical protein